MRTHPPSQDGNKILLYWRAMKNYMSLRTLKMKIQTRTWPKKKNISELYLAWAATIAEIILDPSNGHIILKENIIQPLLEKNLVSINN